MTINGRSSYKTPLRTSTNTFQVDASTDNLPTWIKTAALNVQLHYVVYVIGFDIGDVRYTACVSRLAINAHDTLEHHKRGGIQL